MLSKMQQPNSAGGGGGVAASSGAPTGPGRRLPLSLGPASAVARSNGRSNSPQNGGGSQKANAAAALFGAAKKRSGAGPSASKDEEKKGQNGVGKAANGKEKAPQNGKEQKEQKAKEKAEPKEKPVIPEEAPKMVEDNIVVIDDDEPEPPKQEQPPQEQQPQQPQQPPEEEKEKPAEPSTPTKERKSTRKSGSQQKSPVAKAASASPVAVSMPAPASPAQAKPTEVVVAEPVPKPQPVESEDVEMEALTVDASPIRGGPSKLDAQPAATSTPGRSLFGFRSSSKQCSEVELAAQTSSSPASAPPRTFAQISGRRALRPIGTVTPSRLGSYRCVASDLDTSSCTNASMNATAGSEIPNSSSFSFSFFGRGRKRERTPPLLSGSQSANDLAQDVDMSPPKRGRFELFSLNLASPFSLLRSRFSKTTISTPTRLRLEQTPPGDDGGEVQNVSGIVIEEESPLNTSSASVPEEEANKDQQQQQEQELTVGQEAGLETPKKGGSPVKEIPEQGEGKGEETIPVDGEIVPPLEEAGAAEPTKRCAIM
ncbi:hypothetical protein KR018_012560 [Drosophila ironensis]|nr:hypothetical protein KR018_012560 [Drosophila ironensis]